MRLVIRGITERSRLKLSITNHDEIFVKAFDEIIWKWSSPQYGESLSDIVEVSLLVSLEEELQVHGTYKSLVTFNIKIEKGIGLSIINLNNFWVES